MSPRPKNTDTVLNFKFVDALREVMGFEPLYSKDDIKTEAERFCQVSHSDIKPIHTDNYERSNNHEAMHYRSHFFRSSSGWLQQFRFDPRKRSMQRT